MSEQGKAQVQTLGAGLIGFLGVVAAGAFLVLPHGGGAKVSSSAALPAQAPLNLSAPAPSARPSAGAPAGEAAASSASPAPLLPTDRPEAATVASGRAAAASAASSRTSSRRLAPTAHLDMSGSARSSASASAASAASPKSALKADKRPFVAPKLDVSKSIGIASTVHYGVSSRADIMGRAAGPVYNFSGKALKAPSTGGSLSGQAQSASAQVDQARERIDSSQLSDGDKAKIDSTLDRAQTGVQEAGRQ